VAYVTPRHRREAVQEASDALRGAQRIVLTTHVNADGDGVGSEVAVVSWLRNLGAEAWIVNPTPYPSSFDFLLPEPSWVVNASSDRAQKVCRDADLAVVLDTGEVSRVGRVWPMIEPLERLVVDHHPPGDRAIGGVSFRDPEASATGELVYDLVLQSRGPWTEAVLDGLYVAILTDTGSFRFSNSTPRCHRVTAELIERGADPEALHAQVYGRSPIRRFRLLERSLRTLESEPESGVSWMEVPIDACRDLDAQPDDFEGLVDYPRSIEGTEVALLFRQTNQGDTKVSFRSTGQVDVNRLARGFDGGGHRKASGALVKGPPEKTMPQVLDAARAAVRDLRVEEPAPEEGRT